MKYFSMFSGIGGFEKGIENTFTKIKSNCIGCSEIDKYAIQIYQKHFKEHKNYGDAKRIIWEEIENFDLLCGGFPCQSFSISGRRRGFKDTRGTLFFEIERALSIKRPKLLLLENVKGLLNHDNGRTFGTILTNLSELGYICEWQVLNSKNFGVPQNRERVFIIGYIGRECRPKVFPIKEDSTKTQIEFLGTTKGENCTQFGERDVVMSKDGLCGILKATDYKQPPQILELTKNERQGYRVYDSKGISATLTSQGGGVGAKTGLYLDKAKVRRLTPTECEKLQGFPSGWTEGVSDTQRYKCLGNAVTVNVIEAIMKNM